jgi:chemotaxis signal transduction protein
VSETPLERMRREFDAAFAEEVDLRPADTVDLLSVAVDGRRVAVPVGDLAAVQLCPPLTPLPGADARLIGIAGVRGALVLVYDLGALLGGRRTEQRRFLALRRPDATAGIGFDSLEGYLRLPRSAVREAVVETGAGALAVVRIADLLGEGRDGR